MQLPYIEPIEIPLDYRMDNTLNRETGIFMPKRVLDTCQYVPVTASRHGNHFCSRVNKIFTAIFGGSCT